jgi:hypothetical protein
VMPQPGKKPAVHAPPRQEPIITNHGLARPVLRLATYLF